PEHVVELGYRYRSSAVASEPGDWAVYEEPKEPSASPGTRAPHLALEDGRSTLDLFGPRFVLLAGPQGDRWRAAAEQAGVGAHTTDASGFGELSGVGAGGATLVRPDGFIAWRTRDAAGENAGAELEQLRGRLLGV